MIRMTHVMTLVVALSAAACGSSSSGYGGGSPAMSTQPPATTPRTVTASAGLAFAPSSLTVNAGDTVTFAFESVAHNVFFNAAAGAPADVTGSNANTSITRVFTTPGTYSYTCHIHPFMQGTVVVQ
jgi:plastocyanin